MEEAVVYSLIGIAQPDYGEGNVALGHMLEEIIPRLEHVTMFSWTGKSLPYNSCLPARLAVYSQPPFAPPAIEDAKMDARIMTLGNSVSRTWTDATLLHAWITHLLLTRFSHHRLLLLCIIFTVKKLGIQIFGKS